MGLKVFYHVCAMNDALTIVKEQVTALHISGLYSAADSIHVCVLGEVHRTLPIVQFLHQAGKKFRMEEVCPNNTLYERFTLNYMRAIIEPNDVAFYFHTKGVSRMTMELYPCFEQWARMLLIMSLKNFQDTVRSLQTNECDAAGVNFLIGNHPPHFSGNFWWVRGDYYLSLDPHIGPGYTDPEMYVCSKQPRVKLLYQSNRSHFMQPTSMLEYVDL